MFSHIVLCFRLLYAFVLSSDVFDAHARACVCVCVVHWHCTAQLSMFNMEKRFRNKIIIIIIIYSEEQGVHSIQSMVAANEVTQK